MNTDIASKYIVGIVAIVGAVAIIILLLSISSNSSLTGQVYSVKTKPVTCGDDTCQNWESENNCAEDCSQSEVTGNVIQVKGKSRKWIADAG